MNARIPTANPKAAPDGDEPATEFVFDPQDPAVQRLLAAGIPAERLQMLDPKYHAPATKPH